MLEDDVYLTGSLFPENPLIEQEDMKSLLMEIVAALFSEQGAGESQMTGYELMDWMDRAAQSLEPLSKRKEGTARVLIEAFRALYQVFPDAVGEIPILTLRRTPIDHRAYEYGENLADVGVERLFNALTDAMVQE